MAAPRGRGLRPGGVVRALVRLVLLVAAGFVVGLVFGLVTEEPELLARHLQGESEAVALRAGADAGSDDAPATDRTGSELDSAARYAPATAETRPLVAPPERARTQDLPEVAASRSARPTVEPPDPRPDPKGRSTAAPVQRVSASIPVPSGARRSASLAGPAASNSRPWAIQVGAFSEKKAARQLAEALRGAYPVEILPADRAGGRWRVRVQPIASEAQARATAERIKREERLPTWVTPMEGRSG